MFMDVWDLTSKFNLVDTRKIPSSSKDDQESLQKHFKCYKPTFASKLWSIRILAALISRCMILGWPENIFYNKKRWELRDKQLNMKTRQPKCSKQNILTVFMQIRQSFRWANCDSHSCWPAHGGIPISWYVRYLWLDDGALSYSHTEHNFISICGILRFSIQCHR